MDQRLARGRLPAPALHHLARVVGYLAGVTLKAIEAGNLAARIEMLEATLKQRNGEGKR